MTFDQWMTRENPAHRPTDDSVPGRAFRRCWDAAVAAERERLLADAPPAIPTGDVQDSSWGEWQEASGAPNA